MKINIIEETEDYLVVEKPAGVLVHPTLARETDTLVNWLLEKYPNIIKIGEAKERSGIVHRLDKEASGLLVLAKTQAMFAHLKKQFQEREVEKEYSVLVYGNLDSDEGQIDFTIDRGKEGRMVARPKTDILKLKNIVKIQLGKEAMTEFWVEKRFARFNLLRVKIHTGRTHQIRVHMLAYNHPVVGDRLYSNKKLVKKSDQELSRLFLHAQKLCFTDLNGDKQCFESKLPDELQNYLAKLK